jgi:hypothetical protein
LALLPLPAPIKAIAWYNEAVLYGSLFEIAAADTRHTIAADPKHIRRGSAPRGCCK